MRKGGGCEEFFFLKGGDISQSLRFVTTGLIGIEMVGCPLHFF